jgi:hypothetical protein
MDVEACLGTREDKSKEKKEIETWLLGDRA